MENHAGIYKTKENIHIINNDGTLLVNTDMYINQSFIEELNRNSDNIKHYSDYVNEIFMYYGIVGYTYEKIFNDYKVSKIKVPSTDLYDKVFLSKAIKNNVKVSQITLLKYRVQSIVKLVISLCVSILLSFIFPLYILFTSRNNKQNSKIKNFCVIRSKATDEKISLLKEEFKISFWGDSITYKKSNYTSMYNSSIWYKIIALATVPFITIRDIGSIFKESKQFFDVFFFGHLLYQYMFRIPFKSTYEYYLDKLMSKSVGIYYTGNKEDRYAICEKRIAKKYSIKTICFPHGLEYSFKEPAGLVGDIFYCTSNEAKNTLAKIYQENKFIFDDKITTKMFLKSSGDITKKRNVVFFTEAIDIDVNKKIIEHLILNNIMLYVKLHPKDDIQNYTKFGNKIQIINKIDDAINHNICIARKSTILLEAIYNDSIAIGILINNSDKNKFYNWFPSLNIDKIKKVEQLEDLIVLLIKYAKYGI